MRVSFKFAISFAIVQVAALASSISAIPTNADAGSFLLQEDKRMRKLQLSALREFQRFVSWI
jgi:hypothetical protein